MVNGDGGRGSRKNGRKQEGKNRAEDEEGEQEKLRKNLPSLVPEEWWQMRMKR